MASSAASAPVNRLRPSLLELRGDLARDRELRARRHGRLLALVSAAVPGPAPKGRAAGATLGGTLVVGVGVGKPEAAGRTLRQALKAADRVPMESAALAVAPDSRGRPLVDGVQQGSAPAAVLSHELAASVTQTCSPASSSHRATPALGSPAATAAAGTPATRRTPRCRHSWRRRRRRRGGGAAARAAPRRRRAATTILFWVLGAAASPDSGC
mmetsp:Transcript_97939/g.263193  ORF Transcript_97939/g.263193 Transcript_97939/m.263193 type:complete len:213 (-) Transcript_97939:251-889(-)